MRSGSGRDPEGVLSNRYDTDYEPVTAPEPATLPTEHDRSRRSLLGRLLAPLVVVIGAVVKFGAFILKFFGIFLAVGGYALDLGLVVRDRRRAADPRPPARALRRGAAARARPAAARVHPVPRRTSRCGTCASTRGSTPGSRSPGLSPAALVPAPVSRRRWPSIPTCCARSPTPASCST